MSEIVITKSAAAAEQSHVESQAWYTVSFLVISLLKSGRTQTHLLLDILVDREHRYTNSGPNASH